MSAAENIHSLKVPPHSIEAEQALLAGLMVDNHRWDAVAEILNAEDFYRREHRRLFEAMQRQMDAQKPIDVVTLSEALRAANQLQEAGGIDYLAELLNSGHSGSNATAYAGIVRDRALRRALIAAAHSIADAGYNPEGRACVELLAEAGAKLAALETGVMGDGPKQADAALREAVRALEYRFDHQGELHGLSTGFSDLDAALLGLVDGDLILIAGRPSMGKTTLAMNIAEHVAMSGKPVLVFSLEMASRKLMDRMVCSLGRLDARLYRKGELKDPDFDRMESAVAKLMGQPLFIDDSPMATSAQLLGRARRVAHQYNTKPALIVVDYLQILRDKGEGVERVTRISANLKQLAREMRCPVIALSQLNRGVESRPDKRPIMSDLRDSGALEQDADQILMLYRDEVYNPDSLEKGIAEVLIRKHRDGELGTVRLAAPLSRNRFETLAAGYVPPTAMPKAKGRRKFDYVD